MVSQRDRNLISLIVAPFHRAHVSDDDITNRLRWFITDLFGNGVLPPVELLRFQRIDSPRPRDASYSPDPAIKVQLRPRGSLSLQRASSQLFGRLFTTFNHPRILQITKIGIIGLSIADDTSQTVVVAWYDALFRTAAENECDIVWSIDVGYRKGEYLPNWALTVCVMVGCGVSFHHMDAGVVNAHIGCRDVAVEVLKRNNGCRSMSSQDQSTVENELRKHINGAVTALRTVPNDLEPPPATINPPSLMGLISPPGYQAAVAASILIADLEESSLIELLRCCAETSTAVKKRQPCDLEAAQNLFDQVYQTELQPLNTAGSALSQPKWWAAVPIAIPFVVAGTVLGGPYMLARESARRRRVWKRFQLKCFINAMFQLMSETYLVLRVHVSMNPQEVEGFTILKNMVEELSTKAMELEQWSIQINQEPL